MKIHKFGGSCLRDQKGFQRLTEIISSEQKPVLVTVSAIYGVTQYLINNLTQKLNKIDVKSIITHLHNLHNDLLDDSSVQIIGLNNDLERLENLLNGIVYTEEVTPKSYDLILSFGERLAVHVVKYYLDKGKLSSRIEKPDKLIRTNGVYQTSTILLEETELLCKTYMNNLSHQNIVLIVPGYYGVSDKKEVNLLGRSGTDYTATALGYGLDASEIIIWKDVLGFMSADPSIIKDAKTLDILSYEEAAELSHFGAQILHSRSVIPAKLKNIPIVVKHLYQSHTQTKVWNSEKTMADGRIKSVSYLKDLATLRIYTTLGSNIDGVFNQITQKLADIDTSIISVATSHTCLSILIEKDNADTSIRGLSELKPHIIDEINCDYDIALIGIVGMGLADTLEITSRLFNRLSKLSINVELISSGASKAACHITVKQNRLEDAVNAIHEEFF